MSLIIFIIYGRFLNKILKKEELSGPSFYLHVLFAAAGFAFALVTHCKAQAVTRDDGRDYEPYRRERYERVNYDRADAAGALKYPAYKVEVEYAV